MITDRQLDRIVNAVHDWDAGHGSNETLRDAIDAALGHTRMVEELRNIAKAKPESWDDPSDFKAWAQSRCRAILADHAGEVKPDDGVTPGTQTMPRVNGKPFRCDCGCNVFTKGDGMKYVCNACETVYVGEVSP